MEYYINNTLSSCIKVTSGVPQGGHLSPLLFNIFINDIVSCFKNSEFVLYADDLKIFKIINDQNCSNQLQADLDGFNDWCNVNKMVLNVNKCKCIRFSKSYRQLISYKFGDVPLEQVDVIRDLGLDLFCSY